MAKLNSLQNINIRTNFQYGDLGIVLSLHGEIYHQEYRFNHEFEAYVAEGFVEFVKVYQEDKSRLWIAEVNGKAIGTLAIMERSPQQAQFRWFLIHPDYRGVGLGRLLVKESISFSQEAGYQSIFLWTLKHLAAARALYEKYGFQLEEEKDNFLWGQNVTEQYYVLNFLKK